MRKVYPYTFDALSICNTGQSEAVRENDGDVKWIKRLETLLIKASEPGGLDFYI